MNMIARVLFALCLLCSVRLHADVIWTEGEAATKSSVTRHPWWYDKVDTGQLSGGNFISNWGDKPGEVSYDITAPKAGAYELWLRTNPTATKLSIRINDGDWKAVQLNETHDRHNIAADGKVDLRFIAWIDNGQVELKEGANTVAFRFESENNNHGSLDCFVLANEAFKPRGILKPEEMAAAKAKEAAENVGWFAFDPPPDSFTADAALDLRSLNEKTAGDGGFITAKGPQFVHGNTGEVVRFWAVNGAGTAGGYDAAVPVAKMLAKHGVNLVRLHGGIYDDDGKLRPEKIAQTIGIIDALREQGIYTHLSIYFPLWIKPTKDNAFLKGYDGKTNPFAALYFNPEFQGVYKSWWMAMLNGTSPRTGRKLMDEPALMGCEIVNEDSYFFWTFNDKIPNEQRQLIEKRFGDWATARYGSLDKAIDAWQNLTLDRDVPAQGRLGLRPLWNIVNERTPRDVDTARFLGEQQRRFYDDTTKFLRDAGFKGVITASNWTTASAAYFGPIEKYTYAAGDFLDRHGYFNNLRKGENADWSIREGHSFIDRSAYRFDGEKPGQKSFTHPIFDTTYADKPTMLSETAWERPNRYRGEAPLFYAAYASLQDLDAIAHFALDGNTWQTKPRFFQQPWTLMSPTMMGQFPAAALLYRKALVSPGEVLVDLDLKIDDVLGMKGTPLPEGVSLDELRLKDVPAGPAPAADQPIDPLVHLAGQTRVRFSDNGGPGTVADLTKFIDRKAGVVTASNGQVQLDYKKGLLTIRTPQAQAAAGNVAQGAEIDLGDVTIRSNLDLVEIAAVSLDGQPLATSGKILLQAMTEEKPLGFTTEDANGVRKITNIGRDPWFVRDIAGAVTLKRADAAGLKLTPLDYNGYRKAARPVGEKIELDRDVVYYLIER